MKRDIVEYTYNNCYIPASGIYYKKCNNLVTGKDYTAEFFNCIRDEKRRIIVRTPTSIQPFFKKHNINIGCFDGSRKHPIYITERIRAL